MKKIPHPTIKGMFIPANKDEMSGYPTHEYVCYFHRDPETFDVVYVGEGRYDRAYCINRSRAHTEWIMEQLAKGYTMADIVDIRSTGYTKKEAEAVEKHNIHRCLIEGCELFNTQHNPRRATKERTNGTNTGLPREKTGAGTTDSGNEDSRATRDSVERCVISSNQHTSYSSVPDIGE